MSTESSTPDLLSELFNTLQLRTSVVATFGMPAPWGLHVPEFAPAMFYAVVEGEIHLEVEGLPPRIVAPGDIFLLPRGTTCTLRSSADAPATPVEELFLAEQKKPWAPGQRLETPFVFDLRPGVPRNRFIAIVMDFVDSGPGPVRANLPLLIHQTAKENHLSPWLAPAVQFIVREGASGTPGYAAMATRLAELLFINTIRTHLLLRPDEASGWFRGMSDARVAKVLACIQRNPEADWTVARMAAEAGMSRSSFADRFVQLMGDSPIDFLTGWRMRLAARWLSAGGRSVKGVAHALGYDSEKAFSRAFRRTLGCSPADLKPGKSAQASLDAR